MYHQETVRVPPFEKHCSTPAMMHYFYFMFLNYIDLKIPELKCIRTGQFAKQYISFTS